MTDKTLLEEFEDFVDYLCEEVSWNKEPEVKHARLVIRQHKANLSEQQELINMMRLLSGNLSYIRKGGKYNLHLCDENVEKANILLKKLTGEQE